jgi:hypothetical protein
MNEPLDEAYLKWLYSQVGSIKTRTRARTYWGLLRQLYTKEFLWFIPNDDNRVEDGRDLRRDFFREMGYDPDREWMGLECSVLEMLIALSRRLAFESVEDKPRWWFWHLLENLELAQFNDSYYSQEHFSAVNEIVDALIWRTYDEQGHGGLFPLLEWHGDQTQEEIWYQAAAYLYEREGG